MVNADFRLYNYRTFEGKDEYGQPSISEVKGTIKMALNITTQGIQENILYKDCQYLGLTRANVNDTYIIEDKEGLLKVKYVNPKGRYKQVFLSRM